MRGDDTVVGCVTTVRAGGGWRCGWAGDVRPVGGGVRARCACDLVESGAKTFPAVLVRDGASRDITLTMDALTDTEKQIVADGCLINYYKRG